MAGGRPRGFDVDEALDRALEVFWRQGYEGTALSDLTAAMGINRPSLYATFGNKESLFRKVLDRYADGPAAYAARALELPRARDVAEPLVCINVRTAQACGPDAEPAQHEAMTRRAADHAALRRRFRRAQAEGDLPPGAPPVITPGHPLNPPCHPEVGQRAGQVTTRGSGRAHAAEDDVERPVRKAVPRPAAAKEQHQVPNLAHVRRAPGRKIRHRRDSPVPPGRPPHRRLARPDTSDPHQ